MERTTGKVSSTPSDPSSAVLTGIESLGAGKIDDVVHGTTVALNALLTGRVARTALVTNAGFRDLIEIGRQDRPDIYALHPRKTAPIVERDLRFEVDQRSWPVDGDVREIKRPTKRELDQLRAKLARKRPESIALCLLHSYATPEIEQRIARELERLDVPVCSSAEILPTYREFERFSVCTANAALVPIMQRYLENLARELPHVRLSILQSSGGTLSAERAALEPVRVLFSGPAGGVIGAARAAREAGFESIVTLDMGGTSTDVAFHAPGAGAQNTVRDATIGGHPIAVPALDIHTIGCGGGSLVSVDASGVMHVGPESAGADPGPVSYGRGEILTVTDAHVFLGHIAADGFLGGGLALDTERVAQAFERLGKRLGVKPQQAAQGVLDVARAAMRRALGVMTMQRGHDPKRLPLVAFGGGGGLSAAELAASLDMRGALIPTLPGVLSAYGMATADALRDHELTVLDNLANWDSKRRKQAFSELARKGREELLAAGYRARAIEYEYNLDLRYRGQSFELALPDCRDPRAAFQARHKQRYGWQLDAAEIEIVHLAARAVVRTQTTQLKAPRRRALPKRAIKGERSAWFGKRMTTQRIDRAQLAPGTSFHGPAIVEEFTATTIVPPGWVARVTAGGHLWLERP